MKLVRGIYLRGGTSKAFYHDPMTIMDLVDQTLGKVLD
jgi:3-polyprenyl-4-hydroxybenzoate decarboxylase